MMARRICAQPTRFRARTHRNLPLLRCRPACLRDTSSSRSLLHFLRRLAGPHVLSIFVYPWHERLVTALRQRARGRSGSLRSSRCSLLVPGLLVLTAFVGESRAAIGQLDREALAGQLAVAQQAWDRIRVLIPGASWVDLGTLVDDAISKIGGFIASSVGGLLANIAVLLFQLFVTLIALFFFLRDADAIARELRRALPFEELRRERMIRQTRELVYASVAAGLLIASLQGFAGGWSSRCSVSALLCSGVS